MTKGYYQVPLSPDSIPLTGFVTPKGHYNWRYMAFGLRGAPATFSKLVRKLFEGFEDFCAAYLDDIIIFSRSWELHLHHLKLVLERVSQAHLILNLKKCVFANAELDFLGHHVGLNKIQPRLQKVHAVLNFPQPTSKKQIQSLLGIAGYYRKYLPHYAELTFPLTELLRKDRKFSWNDAAQRSYIDLKSRLASRPILRAPDYQKEFGLAVDASQTGLAACLFQVDNEMEHPVCYISRKLRVHEKNYSTIEKEALALLTAVRACSVYFGSSPVVVYTDHSPLQFLETMANHNQKLLRWKLELQQFNLVIRHRPGRANFLPDFLSRPG